MEEACIEAAKCVEHSEDKDAPSVANNHTLVIATNRARAKLVELGKNIHTRHIAAWTRLYQRGLLSKPPPPSDNGVQLGELC